MLTHRIIVVARQLRIVWSLAQIAAVVIVCLLWASIAFAGPISGPPSGQCLKLSDLTGDLTWTTTDVRSGFPRFAAHDPDAGCAPTVRNPTMGLFVETWTDTSYSVTMPLSLLQRLTCGHVQADFGLPANPGFHSVLIDTEKNCAPPPGTPLVPTVPGTTIPSTPSTPTTPTPPSYVPPTYTPPGETPPTYTPPTPPVSVPDGGSTWLLMSMGLAVIAWKKR